MRKSTIAYLVISALTFYFQTELGVFFYILLLGFTGIGLERYGSKIKKFINQYIKYFYISIIYVLILSIILFSFEQFDSLIVHLFEDKSNLFFFCFFHFPCSILVVWFLPYYLLFSGSFYKKYDFELLGNENKLLYLNLILPVKFLTKERKLKVELSAEEIRSDDLFHAFRRIAGAAFIGLLIYVISDILKGAGYADLFVTKALMIYFVILGISFWIFGYSYAKERVNEAELKEDEINPNNFLASTVPVVIFLTISAFMYWFSVFRTPFVNTYNGIFILLALFVSYHLSTYHKHKLSKYIVKKKKLTSEGKWKFLIGVSALIGLGFFGYLSSLVFFNDITKPLEGLKLYLISNFIFLYVFLSISFFRKFGSKFYIESKRWNFILEFFDTSLTTFLMLLIGILALVFCASFIGSMIHFSTIISYKVHTVNPINIFFIYFNGLFCLIAIVHRWTILKKYKVTKQNKDKKTPRDKIGIYISQNIFLIYFTFALIVAVLFYRKGNSYHKIKYHSFKPNKEQQIYSKQQAKTIEEYTASFLNSVSSDKPIVLIASDGGGLKAAYWTLQTMWNIEKESKIFNKNVFMTSGASGGSIGLGIYTYLQTQQLNDSEIYNKIETLGETNFLSTDFVGLLSRWPLYFLPNKFVVDSKDRMKLMSEKYFKTCEVVNYTNNNYSLLDSNPFSCLWVKENYRIPLFLANTSQMENGRKGIVHPLSTKDDPELFKGYIDISNTSDSTISFPDGLFTTNRFPVFSPYAKIEDKGHFFDAGGTDNSGIGTLLHVLKFMKGKALENDTSVYHQFFENHKIVLLSIRSARSRYVYEHFNEFMKDGSLDKKFSYSSALISSVSNVGLTGIPSYYDDVLDQGLLRDFYGIDEFHKISIPFYLDENSIEEISESIDHSLNIPEGAIDKKASSLNALIRKELSDENNTITGRPKVLDPPLARLLTAPSRDYIKKMSKMKSEEFVSKLNMNEN